MEKMFLISYFFKEIRQKIKMLTCRRRAVLDSFLLVLSRFSRAFHLILWLSCTVHFEYPAFAAT